jgi:hypothetical protein
LAANAPNTSTNAQPVAASVEARMLMAWDKIRVSRYACRFKIGVV